MSKWLVVGQTSFTGHHFIEYLLAKDEDVYTTDLRNLAVLEYDFVVNFQALNVVAPSWKDPDKYFDVNVRMQIPLWDALLLLPRVRYVHVSTPEVYGSTSGYVKEDQPFRPSTPYAASRAAAELLLRCYQQQYGLRAMVTRSCNVYGPGQQLYRLIPKLIVSIRNGIKFPLEGGGRSTRAFLHVIDACEAIYTVATKGKTGEAYNITSPGIHSIAGIVRLTCHMLGFAMNEVVQEVLERPGKDADYMLNDSKIRALGWFDRIKLDNGIHEVITWIEDNWDALKDQSLDYVYKP
jgi:dTDP-glucose 4,6-dehydratase